jgi:xylulokinase
VGVFPSAAAGAERLLELGDRYEPDPVRHAAYGRQYELYRELYPAVADISHRL